MVSLHFLSLTSVLLVYSITAFKPNDPAPIKVGDLFFLDTGMMSVYRMVLYVYTLAFME